MIELLRQHITTRLGRDVEHLEEVLTAFKHLRLKRNEHVSQQTYCLLFRYQQRRL